MHQGHAGAAPPEFERRDGRRILATDHQHIGIEVRMRLAVVVQDLGQLFAGYVHIVRKVIVTGRNNHLAGAVLELAPALVGSMN